MPSARRVHFLLKLTSYFNFEVEGVHTISPWATVYCHHADTMLSVGLA